MKNILVLIGLILIFLGVFQGGPLIFNYYALSEFDKGIVWGSSIVVFIGIFLIILISSRMK